jgi:hypothetical protein
MFYKRTSSREEKRQVNRLRNNLCFIRELVLKKIREQVNRLKIDLCLIKESVLKKKKNRLIGKE